ncbi:hypothetical protein HU200_053381 [Digitaria exilis]|uniref:Uncharacterized protein n=1 Tax=Digitaria exilis TaxID=1010633 RepID=A0A835E6E0_9POAL|nr:hypothetical protein HU200_053381 [Digitaria exilis]
MAVGHKSNKTTVTPVATPAALVLLLLLSSTVSEAGRQLPGHELKWEPPIVYPAPIWQPPIVYPAPIWQPPIIYPGIPPHMETDDLSSVDEQAPIELREEDPADKSSAPVKASNKTTVTPNATAAVLVLLLLLSSTVSEAGRQLPGHELKWEPPIVYPAPIWQPPIIYPAPIWQPPIIYPGIPPHMETYNLSSVDEQAPTQPREEDLADESYKSNETTVTPAATPAALVLLLLLSSTVSEAGRQLPGHELKWEPPIVYPTPIWQPPIIYPAPIWQPPIIYPGIPLHMETDDLSFVDEQAPTELREEDSADKSSTPVKAVG